MKRLSTITGLRMMLMGWMILMSILTVQAQDTLSLAPIGGQQLTPQYKESRAPMKTPKKAMQRLTKDSTLIVTDNNSTIHRPAAIGNEGKNKFLDNTAAIGNDPTIDSIGARTDSILLNTISKKQHRDWSTWRPNPQKALWLALVIPGGGQIYNRKYWKLPIIYGGLVGCVYAMNWNNMMYKDYSQAYLDIMDSDPNTQSYNQFLHLGKQITPENEERYKKIFKSRKDKYRRWRDLSFFCMLGVYAISVIDAYVDAELSEFDISDDLSLRVQPAVMGSPQDGIYGGSSVGVNCSLNF